MRVEAPVGGFNYIEPSTKIRHVGVRATRVVSLELMFSYTEFYPLSEAYARASVDLTLTEHDGQSMATYRYSYHTLEEASALSIARLPLVKKQFPELYLRPAHLVVV
ncbi:MAG: hypothetical protein ACPL3C_08675 [Pyrobaculum sp.]|jgi:endonuclease V-like protein UPF0215 family|uniref:hypothetical protein n=1 Tax=Pyrobaculum sp. TaxID=2004705 RepID=UPI003C95F522